MTKPLTPGEVSVSITVAVPSATAETLDALSLREGVTRSELGREAFALLIEKRRRAREERVVVKAQQTALRRWFDRMAEEWGR